jgi:hypothetical protein
MKPTFDPRAAGLVPLPQGQRSSRTAQENQDLDAPKWSTQLQRAFAEAQPSSAPPPWLGEPPPVHTPLVVAAVDALAEAVAAEPGSETGPIAGSQARQDRAAGMRETASGLRLTVCHERNGVAVWIGAERHVQPHITAVALALRDWLEERGLHLARLTCNGHQIAIPEPARRSARTAPGADPMTQGGHEC